MYILDKAVWLLLATVLTGQALQLAGIMDTPKGAGAIEYQQKVCFIVLIKKYLSVCSLKTMTAA